MSTDLLLSILGLIIGLIMGLTGAGGGVLAVPLLVFGLGWSLTQASPLAMMAVFLASSISALVGLRQGVVRYRAASLMGGLAMLCAPMGLWLAQRLPAAPLTLLFACVLLLSAGRIVWDILHPPRTPTLNPNWPCQRGGDGRFDWRAQCAQLLSFTGLSAGFLAGLLGVGGGFIIVPALRRWTDLETEQITATSLAVIALASLSGMSSAWLSGHLIFHGHSWLFPVMAVMGVLLARRLTRKLPIAAVRLIFAAVCALVAVMMAQRAWTV